MNKWPLILLAQIAALSTFARTWTNQDGKTLEAELVRVKDGNVFLKLDKNRQVHPFEIAKLSETDQAYIKEYEAKMQEKLKAQTLAERKINWFDNFNDAKAEAEAFDMPILLLYTAPEWCGYCVKLEENVFETALFKEFAKQNLVLLIADFSKPADKERWTKKHSELIEKFPPNGYPTTYFITRDLEKLGKLGGYNSDWDTAQYVEKMKGFIKK